MYYVYFAFNQSFILLILIIMNETKGTVKEVDLMSLSGALRSQLDLMDDNITSIGRLGGIIKEYDPLPSSDLDKGTELPPSSFIEELTQYVKTIDYLNNKLNRIIIHLSIAIGDRP